METANKITVQADGGEIIVTLQRNRDCQELWQLFCNAGRRPSSVAINQKGEASVILPNRRKPERGYVA